MFNEIGTPVYPEDFNSHFFDTFFDPFTDEEEGDKEVKHNEDDEFDEFLYH